MSEMTPQLQPDRALALGSGQLMYSLHVAGRSCYKTVKETGKADTAITAVRHAVDVRDILKQRGF